MLLGYFYYIRKCCLTLLKYGLILLCSFGNIFAQSSSNNLRVSLLTCESGNALYSTFGHTAIRIIDPINRKDLVFDFGSFDFETPFFTVKFLRGSLDYYLDVTDFSNFQRVYRNAKRDVIEQQFNLSNTQKQKIYEQLKRTLKSESRYYKYDFLNDNCATRIRDIVDKLPIEKPPLNITTTHRKELKTYLVNKKWLALGIDILLGAPVDKPITQKELMFLPNQLREQLSLYQINGQSLLGTSSIIVKSKKVTIGNWWFLQPLHWAILAIFMMIFIGWKYADLFSRMASFSYFIFGLSGLLLLFLWFGTRHTATQMNYNLLWLNPLLLLLPFLKNGVFKRWVLIITSLIMSLLILFWTFIPQLLNISILPLILILLILNFKIYKYDLKR